MPIPSHPAQSGTFLITSATFNRRRVFQVHKNADLVVETLAHYRSQGHYLLHDYVIMPEHIHLLLTPQNTTLEKVVGLIKGGSSRQIPSGIPIWQKGFDDRRVRDREEFLRYREYIRQNPVKACYCDKPENWKWSSAWGRWRADEERRAYLSG